jgi:putative hydrolase of the HAD superfamily
MSESMARGLRPRRYDAFLLDLYGTLVDIHTDENQPSLWKRLAGFTVSRGAGWEAEALHRAYLDAVEREEARLRLRDLNVPGAEPEIDLAPVFAGLYAARGVEADEALVAETARFFRAASTTHLRLYAGAKELLTALRRQGKAILLSNAQSLFTRPELASLGLSEAFDAVYLSSEAGCKKPDPRFFRLALEREGLEARRCLMIGNDPLCDGEGARAVGMEAWVIRSALSPRELAEGYDQQGMDLRRLQRRLTNSE